MKLSIFLFVIMALAGCSNNSSTGSNNNNTNTGSAIDGGAYVSLSDNLQILNHAKGSVTSYDDSGNVVSVDEYDRDFQGVFGTQDVNRGLIGRNVSANWLNPNSQAQNTIAFVGSTGDTGEVYGFNSFYKGVSQMAILLPQNLTVGQTWEPCVGEEPIQCLLTLKQRLSSFTNAGGVTYSDVLQVYATYFDSSNYNYYGYSEGHKQSGTGTLYFARGVGLVQGDVISYERLNYGSYYPGFWGEFVHETLTGSIWRKN